MKTTTKNLLKNIIVLIAVGLITTTVTKITYLIYDHYQHNPTKTICGFCHDNIDDVTFEVRKCGHI